MMVVCHDAGGAEVISAYIKGHPDLYEYRVFAAGPARDIFARKNINTVPIPSGGYQWANFFSGRKVDLLLTSADWTSQIPLQALQVAKKQGIRTIAYLDHWVCYRERFGYPRQGWEAALPDEMWLGDTYGVRLAKKLFPKTEIRLEPNLYFDEVKRDFYKYISKNRKSESGDSLLFISEPISAVANVLGDPKRSSVDERDILDHFLCSLLIKKYNKGICIRFHPSEEQNKYDDILKKYRGKLKIKKSYNRNIYKDIAESQVVVGMESMAMVVALLCGKRVISLLPDCLLPFREIQKVRSVKNIATVLRYIL